MKTCCNGQFLVVEDLLQQFARISAPGVGLQREMVSLLKTARRVAIQSK